MRLILILALWLFTSVAHAQSVNVDLQKIDPQLAAQILEAQKKLAAAPQPPIVDVKTVKEWAGVGQEVAVAVSTAIGQTAKALNVEVNEFIKTPVGKWTMWILVWKFFLAGILTTVAAGLVWIGGLVVAYKVGWRVFVTLPGEHAKTSNESLFPFHTRDARTVGVVLFTIATLLWSVVFLIKIF